MLKYGPVFLTNTSVATARRVHVRAIATSEAGAWWAFCGCGGLWGCLDLGCAVAAEGPIHRVEDFPIKSWLCSNQIRAYINGYQRKIIEVSPLLSCLNFFPRIPGWQSCADSAVSKSGGGGAQGGQAYLAGRYSGYSAKYKETPTMRTPSIAA